MRFISWIGIALISVLLGGVLVNLWDAYEFKRSATVAVGTVVTLNWEDRTASALIMVAPEGHEAYRVRLRSRDHALELVDAQRFGTVVRLRCAHDDSGYRCRLASEDAVDFRTANALLVLAVALVTVLLGKRG